MALHVGDTPPDHEEDWRITNIGRRARWGSGQQECAVCETQISLTSTHRYVAIGRIESGISRPVATDEFVFCTEECFTKWG